MAFTFTNGQSFICSRPISECMQSSLINAPKRETDKEVAEMRARSRRRAEADDDTASRSSD